MPGELAAVIVLKELRQVPRNADGEDERDGHPEWSVEIGIDALWVMLNEKMVREGVRQRFLRSYVENLKFF